ncbi:hypothetical protein SB717_00515 [Priestia sp. SIMBA_032]|uniref:hypothetical protein n=1 Tax=Priestia sp. SIMBA_032 TaxID=3085775 RepID=UPI00397C0822
MKKRIKMLISIGIAASLIIISSQSKVHASTPIGTVQVKTHSLYLRAGNSFNAKIVRTLHKGEHYNVYAKKMACTTLVKTDEYLLAEAMFRLYLKEKTLQQLLLKLSLHQVYQLKKYK